MIYLILKSGDQIICEAKEYTDFDRDGWMDISSPLLVHQMQMQDQETGDLVVKVAFDQFMIGMLDDDQVVSLSKEQIIAESSDISDDLISGYQYSLAMFKRERDEFQAMLTEASDTNSNSESKVIPFSVVPNNTEH